MNKNIVRKQQVKTKHTRVAISQSPVILSKTRVPFTSIMSSAERSSRSDGRDLDFKNIIYRKKINTNVKKPEIKASFRLICHFEELGKLENTVITPTPR